MRKLWIAICTILASCLLIVGCGANSTNGSSATLSKPESFSMNSKGVLSWDEVDKATSYEVAVDGETVTVETNKQDLTQLITAEGSYTVSVRQRIKIV